MAHINVRSVDRRKTVRCENISANQLKTRTLCMLQAHQSREQYAVNKGPIRGDNTKTGDFAYLEISVILVEGAFTTAPNPS